jgi:predicted dehydrogenase
MIPLTIEASRGEDTGFRPLAVPAELQADVIPGNVARIYARMADDLEGGARTAPSFDDAVALHRTLARIEEAAATGRRFQSDPSLKSV